MDFIYTQEQIKSIMDSLDKLNVKGLDNIQLILQIISVINQPKQKNFPLPSSEEKKEDARKEK